MSFERCAASGAEGGPGPFYDLARRAARFAP